MVLTYAPKADIAVRHEEFNERMKTIPVYCMGIKLHEFDEARLALTRSYATQIIDDVFTIDKESELLEKCLKKTEWDQGTAFAALEQYHLRNHLPWNTYDYVSGDIPCADDEGAKEREKDFNKAKIDMAFVEMRQEYLTAERQKLVETFENLDW